MPPKNSGGSTKFPGGHKVIHRAAQTAFVRVVTPRGKRQISNFVASENYSYTLVNQLGQEAQFRAVVCFVFPTSASRPHQRFPEKRRVVGTF